jgi:diguanylate cyclase (GGDEF) domain
MRQLYQPPKRKHKPLFTKNPYDSSVYRLSASKPAVRAFTIIAGALNLLLLIPDTIHLRGGAVIAVCALRLLYSSVCAVLFFRVRKFRSFKALFAAVTAMELFAAIVFLLVFGLYSDPDFMIQQLGIMLIILVIFMVPNRLSCTLSASILSAAGYLAVTYSPFADTNTAEYITSAIYLAAEIALGAVFAVTSLKSQQQAYAINTELQKVYATDPLTQVGNRVRLEKESKKWFTYCSRHNLPLSLVLFDIDNMKKINDQHGHLTGDAMICELVQIICGNLRKNDVCIRWGGDEFVLLLPGISAGTATRLIERLRKEIELHQFPAQADVTCSFGITDTRQGATLEDMLHIADQSLYQAKKQGKNTSCNASI